MSRRSPLKPLWHPLSTILIDQPRCYATEHLLKLLLGGGELRLIYSGDRMWPAIDDGATFAVCAETGTALPTGSVVVACPSGIPDLLRVVREDADGVTLAADADPDGMLTVPREAIVARARLPRRKPARALASARRLLLDVREAWRGRPDVQVDPADTVRKKYDSQANFYARSAGPDIDPGLLSRLKERVPAGTRVLVVGSGSGRECFALAGEGWPVTGFEFSPSMVELSREEAERRDLDVDIRLADVRHENVEAGSLGGVFFTYDVYSFLPGRDDRVRVLERLRSWLRPDGVVFLSARHVKSAYERAVLGVQWLARQRRGETCDWGDSHTRWVTGDGELRRSFVHVFTEPRSRREITEAGFTAGDWEAGHCVLEPLLPDIIRV